MILGILTSRPVAAAMRSHTRIIGDSSARIYFLICEGDQECRSSDDSITSPSRWAILSENIFFGMLFLSRLLVAKDGHIFWIASRIVTF